MWDSLRPVLLGGDLNSYGMARAFYARYHVRSLVLGRMALGATAHARCLEHRTVPGLSDPRLCVEVLRDLAARTSGATRILLPGTDEYAHTLIEQQGQLAGEYLLPVPGEDQLPLFDKAALYRWGAWLWGPPRTPVVWSIAPSPGYPTRAFAWRCCGTWPHAPRGLRASFCPARMNMRIRS